MAGKSKIVTERQGTPFERLFPTTAATFQSISAMAQLTANAIRAAYLHRVELFISALTGWLWVQVYSWTGTLTRTAIVFGILTGLGILGWLILTGIDRATPWIRSRYKTDTTSRLSRILLSIVAARGLLSAVRTTLHRHRFGRVVLWALGMRSRGLTVRQMRTALTGVRFENVHGKLPKIRRVRSTPVGERLVLHCRPGQSAELLDTRAEELRAAMRARDVRITRDPDRSDRVITDIIRRDPLAATANIEWEGTTADQLSMWDAVHFGTDENGETVRQSLVERSLFLAGEPGSGKSAGMQVVTCHAAKSPDAEILAIDPNRVQFSPWTDRALAVAYDDMDDAIDVLDMVREEGARRLELLEKLPGVHRKLTREIAEGEGIPLWVLLIDELAYHTSVVGSPNGEFAKKARDVVARFRAAGIIPVFATQRPTSDVVPTSLRDLFSMRTAFRTTTLASSDVILGESWARRGYSATDIDLNNRGVSWLLAEGSIPRRIKWAWIPDSQIAELSMTTVRYRPTARTDEPADITAAAGAAQEGAKP
jgi:S-DNA-T family DNA segregation ATPase FtsK/SpoIIIE